MQITIENISLTECKISLTLSNNEANIAIEKTISEFGKDLNLKGFRKGKIPAKVIEERFAEKITKKATSDLIENSAVNALKEHNITPITDLKFEIGEPKYIERGKEFSFSFSFEILPTIELPENLEDISINVTEPMLTPHEMNSIMLNMQKRFATLEEKLDVQSPQENDVVLADVHATYDGKNISGMSANKIHIQISEKSLLPELNELLCSMKIGEELKSTIKAPATYPDPQLQEKDIDIVIRLHKINKEILPAIDATLAKQAGFESIEKLQKEVFFNSMNTKMLANKANAQNKLLESLLEKLEFPIPESLIQRSYSAYMEDAGDALERKGLDKNSIHTALQSMHEAALKDATQRAKSQAFLMALGYRENIVVSDKDVMNFIKQMAKENKQDFKNLYEHIWASNMMTDLKKQILASKSLELMYSNVKKTVVDINGKIVEMPEQYKKLEEI